MLSHQVESLLARLGRQDVVALTLEDALQAVEVRDLVVHQEHGLRIFKLSALFVHLFTSALEGKEIMAFMSSAVEIFLHGDSADGSGNNALDFPNRNELRFTIGHG